MAAAHAASALTALPAVGAMLPHLPATATVTAIIEIADASEDRGPRTRSWHPTESAIPDGGTAPRWLRPIPVAATDPDGCDRRQRVEGADRGQP